MNIRSMFIKGLTIYIVILVISLTGCNNSTKNKADTVHEGSAKITDILDKQQITPEVSPAESTVIPSKDTSEITPETTPETAPEIISEITPETNPEITPEITPETIPVSSSEVTQIIIPEGTADEDNSMTPSIDNKSNPIPEDSTEDGHSLRYPLRAYTILPRDNETADFYNFYYMDNENCLNTFFWKYNTDFSSKYTSCISYKEQSDGSIIDTEISWDNEADKIINLARGRDNMISIRSQWIDENTGDFYIIVCKWTFDAKDNPSFLYGIHPDGKLFVNIRVEDCLLMDKIDPGRYACGYTINYLGQKNGIAYFEYMDENQNAVVYYDMISSSFIKQIFTEYTVKGIIDNQYVGIQENQLVLGSIPTDKELEEPVGNSILTGNSEILQKFDIPDYKGICVNGEYVYLLTKDNFQRIIPGEDNWEVLSNVSQVTNGSLVSDEIGGDLYLFDLIVKDEHIFAILWYADCGSEFFFDIYHLE